ncbi:MAG: peptide/nickel transport system substrate-binding protein [Chloroflexota bacterium]|jgi:peptide/nickel transport system substrate-binding protein|nr:peptide/nickel transport system substrate-binding protein [Chloroflexota bacterium]
MARRWRSWTLAVALALTIVGCASPTPGPGNAAGGQTAGAENQSRAPAAPKRAIVIIRGDVPTILPGARGALPGADELDWLVNVGLTVGKGQGEPYTARMAETLPSTDNGLWKVLPDGRMELTWKLRTDAVWHDGAPVTIDDWLFTTTVQQDPKLPLIDLAPYRFIESIEARDASTLVVTWKRTYLYADGGFVFPLPKHILETAYRSGDMERFQALPYWTEEFVGTGPYRIRQWTHGSGALLEANDRYFLGRPKIDAIEMKFIPDPNTIAANFLAGEGDVSLGGRLALDWAQGMLDRSNGKVQFGTSAANPIVVYIKLENPTPAALLEVDFRRALAHALDREEMVNTLVDGKTSVAHGVVTNPSRADEFQATRDSVVQYPYDPRRATQLIEGLGYRKGTDGFYVDRAGQKITLEIRTTQGDVQQERAAFATAANWQAVGLTTETSLTPAARRNDFEYRFAFPAFDLRRQPLTPDQVTEKFHSANPPTAENNWRGGNYGRYSNPALDRLLEAYDVTIPTGPRMELYKQIAHVVTDQVVILGLFYDVEVTVTASRMKNVRTRTAGYGETVFVHEWDVA